MAVRKRRYVAGSRARESGQGVVEYILLLAIVAGMVLTVMKGFARFNLQAKLMRPISEDFARAYRYGHPKAKGYDDGAPENHPRAVEGGNNFRLFINPGQR